MVTQVGPQNVANSIDSDSVRQGKFKMPKDKPLDRGSTYQNKANGLLDDDGDLPWN